MLNLDVQINLATCRPLLPMEAVAYLLRLDKRRAAELVESGRLAWAWNFAVPPARRRELRVWRGSVAAWLRTNGESGAEEVPESTVIEDILPNRDMWTNELRRRLEIHEGTLDQLVRQKLLRVVETAPMDGIRNGAGRIPRESVLQFLRGRQVGVTELQA